MLQMLLIKYLIESMSGFWLLLLLSILILMAAHTCDQIVALWKYWLKKIDMLTLLETERLVLRQFTLEDIDNLVELNSDPDVVRFTPDQQVGPAVIQTQILPKWFLYYEEYNGYGFWAAVEKSSQAFMGWFQFRPAVHAPYFDPALANPDDIELGYRLRKAFWGQGYATEGSKAILKGFSELGAQRIVSVALAANMASIRVLEKSGLKLEKQFIDEKSGQEVVLYALNHWS